MSRRSVSGEPTKKERTHERILKSAARALRKDGFDALSVGKVMKDAGLTHGGFYAHFPSRAALLEAALDSAAADGLAALEAAPERDAGDDPLIALIERYLSDTHVKSPEAGCALAALGSETRRQSKAVRKINGAHTQQMLSLIESRLGPPNDTRAERALLTLSALVGALVIARSSPEPLSHQVRAAVRRLLPAVG